MLNVRFYITFFSLLLLLCGLASELYGQLRVEQPTAYHYTGAVLRKDQQRTPIGLNNGFSFAMSHQYSVNFMSNGTQAANVNAYSNIMQFGYGDRIDGHVVLSLLHSPFGSNFQSFGGPMGANNQTRFMISDAQFNYRINQNMSVQFNFSQMPNNAAFGQPFSPFNQRFYRPFP